MNQQDTYYLQKALTEAKKGAGLCAPNPAVGAVVVEDNNIVGYGYHRGPGNPHAEVGALQQAGEQAKGATIYVTLEPCCHHGRTPPCTDAIQKAGITKVVYAQRDINHHTDTVGESVLKAAGIECYQHEVDEISQFYFPYNHWVKTQLPWVVYKLAVSLNGKIAGPQSQPLPITGEEAKQLTHHQRMYSDAILTTARTIIHDDPKLNVRFNNLNIAKLLYVIDRRLEIPLTSRIFKTAKRVTLFYNEGVAEKEKALRDLGVRLIPFDDDLSLLLKAIGQDGIHRLWVEAGGCLYELMQSQKLINEFFLYIAPILFHESYLSAFHMRDSLSHKLSYCHVSLDVICHSF